MCRMIMWYKISVIINDIHLQNNEIHEVKPIMTLMRKAARPHAIREVSGPETRVSLGVALG